MELNKVWKSAFLVMCGFSLGWFVSHIQKDKLKDRFNKFIGKNNSVPYQKVTYIRSTSSTTTVTARPNSNATDLQLFSRDSERWNINGKICDNLPVFMRAMLRTSAGSFPMFIHNPRDDIHVSRSIASSGAWEGGFINLILSLLGQDQRLNFIDLGANLGVYSLAVAKLGRKVVSVDALSINIQRMCSSIRTNNFNKNVFLVYNALSDVREIVSLGADKGNIGGTFVAKDKNPNKVRGSRVNGNYGSVQTAKLDDILDLPGFDIKKAVIKMDVEGYENRVFRGGEKFFQNVNVTAVLMEWMWLRTGPAGQEIVEFFKRHNFEPTVPSLNRQPLSLKRRGSWPNDVLWRKKL